MSAMRIVISLCLAAQAFGIMEEMSWKLDPDFMSYPPGGPNPYSYTLLQYGPNPELGVPFVTAGKYETLEHLGTHMDAPVHFFQQGKHIDELPLEDLNGPLVAINQYDRAHHVQDSGITIDDLQEWESKYGPVPPRSFVLSYSGWDEYWGDNDKYWGSNGTGPFHFPGFETEAVQWLLDNRDILGVGSDSIACDTGLTNNMVHRTILPAGKVCIENLRNVGRVPECGARFMMFPIMLKNGTGAQGRALAEWFPDYGYGTTCNGAFKESPHTAKSASTYSSASRILTYWPGVVLAMILVLALKRD